MQVQGKWVMDDYLTTLPDRLCAWEKCVRQRVLCPAAPAWNVENQSLRCEEAHSAMQKCPPWTLMRVQERDCKARWTSSCEFVLSFGVELSSLTSRPRSVWKTCSHRLYRLLLVRCDDGLPVSYNVRPHRSGTVLSTDGLFLSKGWMTEFPHSSSVMHDQHGTVSCCPFEALGVRPCLLSRLEETTVDSCSNHSMTHTCPTSSDLHVCLCSVSPRLLTSTFLGHVTRCSVNTLRRFQGNR